MRPRFQSLSYFAAALAACLGVAFVLLRPSIDSAKERVVRRMGEAVVGDSDRDVRGTAARALGKMGGQNAIRSLLLAYDRDPAILSEVAEALLGLGVTPSTLRENAAKKSWLDRADRARVWLRRFHLRDLIWAIALWTAGWSIAVMVRARLHGRSATGILRAGYRTALGHLVSVTVGAVIFVTVMRNLPPPPPQPHFGSAEFVSIELARMTRDRASVQWLCELLGNPQRPTDLRCQAAHALGAIGDRLASEALEEALEYTDPKIRKYAAWALGNLFIGHEKEYEAQLNEAALDQEAVGRLSALLSEHPSSAALYQRRSAAYVSLARYENARADLDKALALSAGHREESYTERGWTLALLSRLQEAIADYTRAIEANPRYAVAYFRRALAKSALGDRLGAVQDLDQVLELDPKHVQARLARGDVLRELGDISRARGDYERVLEYAQLASDREEATRRIEGLR